MRLQTKLAMRASVLNKPGSMRKLTANANAPTGYTPAECAETGAAQRRSGTTHATG